MEPDVELEELLLLLTGDETDDEPEVALEFDVEVIWAKAGDDRTVPARAATSQALFI